MEEVSLTFWQIAGISLGIAGAIFGIGAWVGRINEKVSSNSTGLAKTNNDQSRWMEKINDNLLAIFDRLPSPTVAGASPKKLTPLGKQISSEVGASDWARRAFAFMDKAILEKEDHEIYDLCIDYSFGGDNIDGVTNELIARAAYAHGINVADVLAVFPIVLRDTIIEAKTKRTWTE